MQPRLPLRAWWGGLGVLLPQHLVHELARRALDDVSTRAYSIKRTNSIGAGTSATDPKQTSIDDLPFNMHAEPLEFSGH